MSNNNQNQMGPPQPNHSYQGQFHPQNPYLPQDWNNFPNQDQLNQQMGQGQYQTQHSGNGMNQQNAGGGDGAVGTSKTSNNNQNQMGPPQPNHSYQGQFHPQNPYLPQDWNNFPNQDQLNQQMGQGQYQTQHSGNGMNQQNAGGGDGEVESLNQIAPPTAMGPYRNIPRSVLHSVVQSAIPFPTDLEGLYNVLDQELDGNEDTWPQPPQISRDFKALQDELDVSNSFIDYHVFGKVINDRKYLKAKSWTFIKNSSSGRKFRRMYNILKMTAESQVMVLDFLGRKNNENGVRSLKQLKKYTRFSTNPQKAHESEKLWKYLLERAKMNPSIEFRGYNKDDESQNEREPDWWTNMSTTE
ncbi:hypothetical protein CAEBREN_24201 [Caenorhabditis brenneri]|uniref:Uncharacterized protein n=1 Tax=Caenorhabditis brenneri TaxID=135651 RepID=G0P3P0_CAEBE|nr:hypothetical protein CAEBREN_24201 [Caenorhabditis brenneri]